MAMTVPLLNQMLVAASSFALFMSIHNGDPGTTGANQLGALRQTCSWAANPTSAQLKLGMSVPFAVAAANTVGFFGLWTATTAGTFCGGGSLAVPEYFAGAGTYSVSSIAFTLT